MKVRESLLQRLRRYLQNPSVGALIVTVLVLAVLLPAWWLASGWYQTRLLAEARSRASGDISLRANALSAALNRRFSLLDGLYAFSQVVIQDENFGRNFETFAASVYGSTSGIRTIAVAPGGVVYYVYPIEDNVRVVGYNPLEDPRPGVKEEVERAIQSQQIVLSGPTELTDGGIGVVARKAVYQGDNYWGLVNLVVDLNPILSLAGIGVQDDVYDLVLRDQSGQIFYGQEQVLQADPIDQSINLPDGIWVLSGAPKGGWQAAIRSDLLLFQVGLLTIVGLVGSLVYLSVNRQSQLGAAVRQRTQELTRVNQELETDIAEREKAEAALGERETQYRSIFEAVSDGLFINTLEGVLADFNPAAAQMHGYSLEEFRRLQPPDFIHPDSYSLFAEYLENIKAGKQFRGRAIDLHKDGTLFFVEVTGKQFLYQGKPHALAVLRDVTEQVQAYQLLEKRVQERTREIAALLEVGRNVASTLDLSLLLELVLNQLKTVVDYTGAGIATLEDENFVFLDYQGPTPREEVLNLHIPADLPSGYQEVVRSRGPVIIPDIWDTSSQSSLIKQHSTENMKTSFGYVRSWLGVPLMVKDRLIGVLRIDHDQPNRFDEGHAQLVLAFANQAAVAIENARLYQRAQTLAVLEERQRLARELHDSVSQALYGIALGARTTRTLLEREDITDPAITGPIDYVMSLAEAGLAEMRALIFELRPESLQNEGLVAAVNKQAEALQARHQINVSLDLHEEPTASINIKETIYRVIQEAMHNTIKHAQASRIEVCLAGDENELFLEVKDDGIGFDTSQEFPGHLGLHSMRERVEGLGGRFVLESSPGTGTNIQAWIPIAGS